MRALTHACIVWGGAAALTLAFYLARSADDLTDLVLAAVRSSAHALWFVPAMLLLTRGRPVAQAVGFLLVANTVRLLLSHAVPSKLGASSGEEMRRRRSRRLFRYLDVQRRSFAVETLPAIVCAVGWQMGVVALVVHLPWVAAGAVACSAAGWMWSSIARGGVRRRQESAWWVSLLSVAATLFLSTAMSLARLGVEPSVGTAGSSPVAEVGSRQATTPLANPQTSPIVPGKGLISGLVLRPDAPPPKKPRILPPVAMGFLAVARPLVIPFSGDYHVFPSSSGHVWTDSPVRRGTPLDAVYKTNAGGPMETEAYQRLDPPIDFGNCGKVRVAMKTAEATMASATMQLVGADGLLTLPPEFFGLETKAQEVLEFSVPALPAGMRVVAIRVTFQGNPAMRDRSTRIAIDEFALLPR